jgi:hypothetical protein
MPACSTLPELTAALFFSMAFENGYETPYVTTRKLGQLAVQGALTGYLVIVANWYLPNGVWIRHHACDI